MPLLPSNPNKPNRFDSSEFPNKDTNKEYHIQYAKWAVSSAQTPEHSRWLERISRNKKFYMGRQWEMKEDITTFLQDSTGQQRNRIQVVANTIRPMVEQYRGNASILRINATAKSISKLSVNRRDMALSEKLFKTKMANELPGLGVIMRKNDKSIGQDEQETTQIFENLYVDMYVSQMNSLLKYVTMLNDIENQQIKVAQDLAISGLIAVEGFCHGGHRRYSFLEPEDCFWDSDARKLDLSDADFCGYVKPMDGALIYERWQPGSEDVKAIEDYISTANDTYYSTDTGNTRQYRSGRVPVYKVYWKDSMKIEYGYVKDEYGYDYLTKINYTEPGEDSPRYTDADLIDPPDNQKNRRLFKGKKKRSLYVDCVRYCVFIPGEVVSGGNELNGKPKYSDIVLDFGMEEYQETEYNDISNVKFPLKFQTWGYVDGEVFSPIDDAISPQRLINRILSVTEQGINNSGGAGMIIDEDAIDPNDRESIYHDSKEGKTLTVRTRGKGVPNTVTAYDNTPKAGIYNMFNIVTALKQLIQDSSGVNEALKGESTGNDQLVGVTQLLIQRGSLMQEPFYAAISKLYVQIYQDIATVAKRFYIDNERELSIIVGDDGVNVFELSKDLRNEDFRVFVSRENDDSVLKSQANQMLEIFRQQGLIDERVYANLYNRSTPEDVTLALRSQAGLRIEAARRQAIEQTEALNKAKDENDFLQERDRTDRLNAQAQQERIQDKNNETKRDTVLTKALVEEDNARRNMA